MDDFLTNEQAYNRLLDLVAGGLAVRTNSSLVREGEVFVALPGTTSGNDGSAYIPDAVARGAAYVLAGPGAVLPPQTSSDGAPVRLIAHPDPRTALGELANRRFGTRDRAMKLLAITGTNGKTTISYLIERLLAAAGLKAGVVGTISYRWPGFSLDAPLTTPGCWQLHELLANMARADVDVAVMEVSSHAIDQQRVAGLEFHTAVLTNVTQDHLDYHGDMETYYAVKSRLFTWGQGPKHSVLNCDDRYGRRLVRTLGPGAMSYGLGSDCLGTHPALKGELLSCDSRGIKMTMRHGEKTFPVSSPLVGRHNAENLLAAVGAGLTLGLGCREFKSLADFSGVPGRLERVENDRGLSIFVDYAHTPDALASVLTTLRNLDFKRLITVFGCGGNRDKAKRPLMAQAVARMSDVCVLTSDNPRFENPADIIEDVRPGLATAREALVMEDRAEAIDAAVMLMRPGDCLLVAGKGHETYQEISGVRRPFSDVEQVRLALARRGERQA